MEFRSNLLQNGAAEIRANAVHLYLFFQTFNIRVTLSFFLMKTIICFSFPTGSQVGFADYYVFPLLDRLEACYLQLGLPFPSESDQPRLVAWLKAMRTLPAVQAYSIKTDRYFRFAESNKADSPDYNI